MNQKLRQHDVSELTCGWMTRNIPVPPRGTCEASPPFQRREGEATKQSPRKGTTELAVARENLNGLECAPS